MNTIKERCSSCQWYIKKHSSSGDCIKHYITLKDTRDNVIKRIEFNTLKYYWCSYYESKYQLL